MRAWSVPESFTHTQPLQVLDNLCPLPLVLQVGRLREPCSQEERHCGRKIQVCSGEGGGRQVACVMMCLPWLLCCRLAGRLGPVWRAGDRGEERRRERRDSEGEERRDRRDSEGEEQEVEEEQSKVSRVV